MRPSLATILFLGVAALAVHRFSHAPVAPAAVAHGGIASTPILPDGALTSGVDFAADLAKICSPRHAKPVRPVSGGDEFNDKRRLENYLYRQVCSGRIPLGRAQAEIAGNWLAAYRKYFGPP